MPVIAIEAIIRIVMYILQWIVMKKINDKELRAAFVQFAELARTENIKTIMARHNVDDQLKAGDDYWTKVEEEKKNEEQTK